MLDLATTYVPKFAIFHEETAKNGLFFFFQKLCFLASDKQFKTSPPIVLDGKKQVVGTQRSRKHKLQHPYAPKFAVFHEKTAKNGLFFAHKLSSFGVRQAVKAPHPPFRGCWMRKGRWWGHTDHENTMCHNPMHPNVPFLIKNRSTTPEHQRSRISL